jgi:hypothetical protein
MSKYTDIVKGITSPRYKVQLALLNGPTVDVDLIPLDTDTYSDCIQGAEDYARSKGVKDPKPKEPQYEIGLMMHVILRACIDFDVKDREEPFFASIDEIKHVDPDRLGVLFHQQRNWQSKCAPLRGELSAGDYMQSLIAIAHSGEDEDIPFDSWPYAMRRYWLRLTAGILLDSPTPSSEYGSTFMGILRSMLSSVKGSTAPSKTSSSSDSSTRQEPTTEAMRSSQSSPASPGRSTSPRAKSPRATGRSSGPSRKTSPKSRSVPNDRRGGKR